MNELPRMLRVRQRFPESNPIDFTAVISAELSSPAVRSQVRAGIKIGVGVGSRGIANLPHIIRSTVQCLSSLGADVFLFPAMGSHGGATPEGQRDVLAGFGITETAMGVPIDDSMEVRCIGRTEDGVDVYCSAAALSADGILLVNRIKPHTDFFGTLGSGLLKMSVIGLGKRLGAATMHRAAATMGYERAIRSMGSIVLANTPILGGLAILENQFHETAQIGFIERDAIEQIEPEWLRAARDLMPLIPFDDIDLLIVDQIGKEISGAGMDPNVIQRSVHGYSSLMLREDRPAPFIRRILVRELSQATHGNAIGIGMADATTTRLVRSIDTRSTYINALTANTPQSAKIPVTFDSDREGIETLLDTLPIPDWGSAKVVRIRDTLSVANLEVSESLWHASQRDTRLERLTELREIQFDADGNLLALEQ